MEEQILEQIKEILKRVGYESNQEISMESNITQAGIDSLMYIQLIVELELIYEIEINPDFMFTKPEDTIGQVVEEVVHKLIQRR